MIKDTQCYSTPQNVKSSRAPNDIYVMYEENKACLLAKEDESWLWHKLMGHINLTILSR